MIFTGPGSSREESWHRVPVVEAQASQRLADREACPPGVESISVINPPRRVKPHRRRRRYSSSDLARATGFLARRRRNSSTWWSLEAACGLWATVASFGSRVIAFS